MKYNAEQIVNGIMRYADNEVMPKLPTAGKWVFGTAINLANNKVNNLIEGLQTNAIAKMLDIVDDNGNIDADALFQALKESADRYGVISIEVPLIGSMTFSTSDIDSIRGYIV